MSYTGSMAMMFGEGRWGIRTADGEFEFYAYRLRREFAAAVDFDLMLASKKIRYLAFWIIKKVAETVKWKMMCSRVPRVCIKAIGGFGGLGYALKPSTAFQKSFRSREEEQERNFAQK